MTNLENLLLNYIINIACVSLGVGDINRYMINNNQIISGMRISDKQIVSRAFTIVELLVVIVVIGILAAITIVSYTGLISKATVASLQSDLAGASKQLKIFQTINGVYPNVNACPAVLSTDICLKSSPGVSYTYNVNNTANPQVFSLHATKDNTYYHVTNDSSLTTVTPVVATGGTITNDGRYRIHTFTTSGTFTVTTAGDVEVLVVGGGGGGGGRHAGGGGAGGVTYVPFFNTVAQPYSITIGAGGTAAPYGGRGGNGGNSVFSNITSIGGGGGGGYSDGGATVNGCSGGSGGGGAGAFGLPGGNGTYGVGTVGQGNSGGMTIQNYIGGGGGGAGTTGSNTINNIGGAGGNGISLSISGTATYYGGGGGGAGDGPVDLNGGIGGLGGGGRGTGAYYPATGLAGIANTGGGGGGSRDAAGTVGGSGVVIIRYLTP
jgi:prepilin-type N-terminal cleavage/methylation domain-containing protein